MDDTQRIVKCGNLALHTPGGFFKKRWHSKYLVLYDGSKSGIKRLELFDSEIKFKKQQAVRIIPLVDCIRVVTCQRHKTSHTFEVRTSDQFYLLAAQSFQDMNDWVNCLRLVAFGQTQQGAQQARLGQKQHQQVATSAVALAAASAAIAKRLDGAAAAAANVKGQQQQRAAAQAPFDVLLERRPAQQVAELASVLSRGGAKIGPSSGVNKSIEQLNLELHPEDAQSAALARHQQQQQQQQQQDLLTCNGGQQRQPVVRTASQAAAAAASALAKARQRQPSLLGSCKPLPPTDSPFIREAPGSETDGNTTVAAATIARHETQQTAVLNSFGQLDTLTPTVRGQLIASHASLITATTNRSCNDNGGADKAAAPTAAPSVGVSSVQQQHQQQQQRLLARAATRVMHAPQEATLDEEEENMLYCSIEDNPSEHNYRVKVIETELSLRCQLKCYPLTEPTMVSQQYEELSQFRQATPMGQTAGPSGGATQASKSQQHSLLPTFYQLIIGPQELTLLNDYATLAAAVSSRTLRGSEQSQQQQQGLWSWPYQCIRRYGFDKDNCFMFEAGRKCTSGPGQFIVQTPKAYNIYQDVVKFVNELRTLGPPQTQLGGPANCVAQADGKKVSQNPSAAVVTQIPVVWTPGVESQASSADGRPPERQPTEANVPAITSDSIGSRKNFFDALRQLEGSGQEQQATGCSSATTTTTVLQFSTDNTNQLAPTSGVQQQLLQGECVGGRQLFEASASNGEIGSSQSSRSSSAATSPQNVPTDRPPNKHQVATPVVKTANSTTSDETDESGYEQGDESVESHQNNHKEQLQQARVRPTNNAEGGVVFKRKRQAASDSACNISSSSASSTTSSFNEPTTSPGQSIGLRSKVLAATTNTKASGGQATTAIGQFGGANGPTAKRQPAGGNNGNGRVQPETDQAVGVHNNRLQAATTAAAVKSNALTGSGVVQKRRQQLEEDFESNLIRDVYSEITKLHAKFAVTSNGSATDDSMSSNCSNDSSSTASMATISTSSSVSERNNSDCDLDANSPSTKANDALVEPMYSNVAIATSTAPACPKVASAGGAIYQAKTRSSRELSQSEVNRREDATVVQSNATTADRAPKRGLHLIGNDCSDKQALASNRNNQQQQQQSHHHSQDGGRQYQYEKHNLYPEEQSRFLRDQTNDFNYLSPRQMSTCHHYPSILNPIPECSEQSQLPPLPLPPIAPKPQNQSLIKNTGRHCNINNNDSHHNQLPLVSSQQPTTTSHNQQRHHHHQQQQQQQQQQLQAQDGVPRMRLSNVRNDIKKFNKLAATNGQKPTNHYVINDVQYAKISRTMQSKFEEACL